MPITRQEVKSPIARSVITVQEFHYPEESWANEDEYSRRGYIRRVFLHTLMTASPFSGTTADWQDAYADLEAYYGF